MKKGDFIYCELDTIRCVAQVDDVDLTTFDTNKAIADMGSGWQDFHSLFPGQKIWKEKRKYFKRKATTNEIEELLLFYDL